MRNLKQRFLLMERHSAARVRTARCDHCRDWPSVCLVTVDVDATETWKTDRPQQCPNCGWIADQVTFHAIAKQSTMWPRAENWAALP